MHKQENGRQTCLLNDRPMKHSASACVQIRRSVMTIKSKLAMIAASAALGVAVIGVASPALAQSAYTTGTESDSVSAGYPSPYGNGIHTYAPALAARHSRGLDAFAM